MSQLLHQRFRCALVAALFISGLVLGGCASDDKKAGKSAEQLYDEAHTDAANGSWEAAAKGYAAVQARSPFGRLAQQSQMEEAYAQWRSGDTAQALATIDRFIKQYPNHYAVDYMYYLRGVVNFNDGSSFLDSISGQDPAERDPKAMRDSFDAFKELITRFPDSRYADDSRQRMRWLVGALARNEVHVARYYYRRGAYVAAIGRAQSAIKSFEGAQNLDEALAILVASYDKLGMTQPRDDAARVLRMNYPDSPFIAQGLKDPERKWWQFW